MGRVIDRQTNELVIGASIRLNNTDQGSISNENGEFQLVSKLVKNKLTITHISYKSIEVDVNDNRIQTFYLDSAPITLPEASVGNPALNLINLVIKKAIRDKNHLDHYKSFYQKTSKIDGKYNKIHEMFFEMNWSTEGIQLWKPVKSRYAEKLKQRYVFKNFIYSSFLNTSVLGRYSYFPLSEANSINYYNYKIVRFLNIGTKDEIAVIKCSPKKDSKNQTTFSGELFIDTTNEILLKLKGTFNINKSGKWKNKKEVEVNFEKVGDKSTLKYVHIEHYSTNVFAAKRNVEKAWIYCIEKKTKFEDGKVYKIDEVDDDLTFFQKVKYEKKFWEAEVPIFHTQLEKEIIQHFEKNGMFKSNL
jgi:hypothetical protein